MDKRKLLHWNMSCFGEFMGTYSILLHAGNFGNAQTGNMIMLVEGFMKADLLNVLIRLGALILFASGIGLSYLLSQRRFARLPFLAILIDGLALFVTGLLPGRLNPVLSLYFIFFAASFQWGSFSGTETYKSSSIFISNNLRQAVQSWIDYYGAEGKGNEDHANLQHRQRAVFYTVTILCFFAGSVLAAFLIRSDLPYSSFFGEFLLLPAFFLERSGHRRIQVSKA